MAKPGNQHLEEIYQRMLKHSRRDFLNCGACGYGSCELMATAIHNGLNRPENCFHYERESRLEMNRVLFDGLRHTTDRLSSALNQITGSAQDDSGEQTVSIKEIAQISRGMRASIEEGLGHIERTIATMQKIRESNQSTAERVNVLNEQIQSIWEIVGIISAIADQTKIIAFNAELEASAAGETGRSFEIVAAEIRRLANSTGTSTARIREKIDEIQTSSSDLTRSSEQEGTTIAEGEEIAAELESIFTRLTEFSSESDKQINTSIEGQVAAFEDVMEEIGRVRQQMDQHTHG